MPRSGFFYTTTTTTTSSNNNNMKNITNLSTTTTATSTYHGDTPFFSNFGVIASSLLATLQHCLSISLSLLFSRTTDHTLHKNES